MSSLRVDRWLIILGRFLFAFLFIISGIGHFTEVSAMAQYAAAQGIPLPAAAVMLTGILLLAGGASVLVGYRVRVGASLLLLFLVPTTLIMHAFWGVDDPMDAQLQQVMFMKNLSLAGAALLICCSADRFSGLFPGRDQT